MFEIPKTAYELFDPDEHLGGVLSMFAAEGWASFTPEATVTSLTAPGVVSMVAVSGKEIVGVAQMQTDGVLQAHLSVILVAQSYRGSGIGRGLIEETFEKSGAQRVDFIASDESVGFYKSFKHREQVGFRLYPGEDNVRED